MYMPIDGIKPAPEFKFKNQSGNMVRRTKNLRILKRLSPGIEDLDKTKKSKEEVSKMNNDPLIGDKQTSASSYTDLDTDLDTDLESDVE